MPVTRAHKGQDSKVSENIIIIALYLSYGFIHVLFRPIESPFKPIQGFSHPPFPILSFPDPLYLSCDTKSQTIAIVHERNFRLLVIYHWYLNSMAHLKVMILGVFFFAWVRSTCSLSLYITVGLWIVKNPHKLAYLWSWFVKNLRFLWTRSRKFRLFLSINKLGFMEKLQVLLLK